MRIRTIKPEFFIHGELFDAEVETGLPIRVAFIGLWCAADREGRFGWKPRELKAQILPHDSVDFSRVLDALTTRGFLVKYASGDREFGWIPSFSRHQVINNKEKSSDLPDPCDATTSTRAPRVPHACPTPLNLDQGEGKGREGNMEGKGKEHGRDVAGRLLAYLNEKSGYRFRQIDSNLKLIDARLSEPEVTEEGIRQMIDRQCARWKSDPKMAEYLRPVTLFGKEKFNGYYDMRNAPVLSGNGSSHHRPSLRSSLISGGDEWDRQAAEAIAAVESGLAPEGFGTLRDPSPEDCGPRP